MTCRIALEGLEFHAFHGVYPHERESGNCFQVDISVEADFSEATLQDDLAGTVNYETLYHIVSKEMETPSKLLETVAQKIIDDVMSELPKVLAVDLRISNINPPIGGKCKKATLSVSRRRT